MGAPCRLKLQSALHIYHSNHAPSPNQTAITQYYLAGRFIPRTSVLRFIPGPCTVCWEASLRMSRSNLQLAIDEYSLANGPLRSCVGTAGWTESNALARFLRKDECGVLLKPVGLERGFLVWKQSVKT